jgi:hypothetical protein
MDVSLSFPQPPAESFQGAPKAGVFSQTLLKALLGHGLKRWPLGSDGFVGRNHQKMLGRIFSNIVVGVGYPDKDVEGWSETCRGCLLSGHS